MAKFIKRTKKPDKTNKYYNSNINPFVAGGFGMFQNKGNCTCYAYGRFYELIGTKPNLSTANAENWYLKKDGYKRGKTPKLGAIICWRKGEAGKSKDGAGHVAVVEEIKSNGDIVVSNSGWKSFIFKTRTLKKSNNYKLSGNYALQGFIYCPKNFEEVYTTGNYITLSNLYVRSSTSTANKKNIKKVKQLTADGKKCATSKDPKALAIYKKGTEFTASKIEKKNGVWAKTPSGYVCIKGASGKVYCKKND